MSFSQEVKRELCAVPVERDCDALGECYGVLLFANLFRQNGIRIITGNDDIAGRVELFPARVRLADKAPPRRAGGQVCL